MARNIKINCRRVHNVGTTYGQCANEVKAIQDKMKMIGLNIASIWQGHDSNNFLLQFASHVQYLNNLVDFLNDKSEVLKQNALNHNNADREFVSRIKRTDFDE